MCSPAACLALYGIVPWRAVPVMPVEIMLLPKWFPFHLDKISYWSRTVIVPLLVLMAKKPRARNAKGVTIGELFLDPPQSLGPTPKAPQQKAAWFWFFRAVDNVLRAAEPYFPKAHAAALDRSRRGLGWRAIERRGRPRRDFSGDGEQRDDVLTRSAIRRIIRSAPSPANRSRSSLSCTTTKPIASPASRRSGTPGSPATRSWKSAASARLPKSSAASTGSSRCRCSTCAATGSRGGPICGPAAGRSNTPIRIIPTSTIPPSWRWRWTACKA